jgi:lipoprotein-anchoring transpeptidase ErfK/SrfK
LHQAWRVAARNVARLAIVAFLSPGLFNGAVARASQREEPQLPREIGCAHVEIDLSRQRLFVVDGSGRVVKTLPVSSGNGKWFTSQGRTRRAITPTGRFTVFRKIAGWRKSPLGMLYYPSYICDGVAIHGSRSVPSRPASHGCIRIPMSAAKELSDLTPIGTVVLVY